LDRERRVRWGLHIAAILVVACSAGGCESLDVLSPQRSAALVNKIQLGMSRTEVIDQLGQPQKLEAQGTTELLFYRTIWQVAEQAKFRSPIAIRDGVVVGFGSGYTGSPDGRPGGEWDAWVVDVQQTGYARATAEIR
jgi:hypothetical protein